MERAKVKNLLNGLTDYNRGKRLGYTEIKQWVGNPDIIFHTDDEANEKDWSRPCTMYAGVQQEKYWNKKDLFGGLTKDERHWETAKSMLYSNVLYPFFSSIDPGLAQEARKNDELYRSGDPDKGLAEFLKKMYPEGPIVWRGETYQGLKDLGNKLIASKDPKEDVEILQKNLISFWLEETEGIHPDEETIKLVKNIEQSSTQNPEIACYWFGNAFADEDQRHCIVCGEKVTSIQQLAEVMFRSPARFYQMDGLTKLMDRKTGADLYGFLYGLGFKPVVDGYWQRCERRSTYEQGCLLFAMMEEIIRKSGLNCGQIRSFFANYGPIGSAIYVQKLLREKVEPRIYVSFDAEGNQLLQQIANRQIDESLSVTEQISAVAPLLDQVKKLRENLTDNPYLIKEGLYERKGIICTNLKGCFQFELYDVKAPLGFYAEIETK